MDRMALEKRNLVKNNSPYDDAIAGDILGSIVGKPITVEKSMSM